MFLVSFVLRSHSFHVACMPTWINCGLFFCRTAFPEHLLFVVAAISKNDQTYKKLKTKRQEERERERERKKKRERWKQKKEI